MDATPRTRTLEHVLADARGDAAVYRRRGDPRIAAALESFADEVRDAAEDYLTWLSEDQAMLRSGHREPWFRRRRAEWVASGNARQVGRRWRYRAVVVPQRGSAQAAYEAGLHEGDAA